MPQFASPHTISRIGIIGGSFDPVHNGHLRIAETAQHKYKLDKVIFVPAYCPPHKARPTLAPYEHRFRMIGLAIKNIPAFEVSNIEAHENCPSFAGTTVETLKTIYGSSCIYCFIIGLDALLTLTDREKSHTYPGLCYFIATTRPGFNRKAVEQEVPREFIPYILINEMPAISISSSDIKNRIRTNQPIDGMVPVTVKDYIFTFKVYTSSFT
jgi:nicotinate-nucleotide adenylyltransferase